jgi:hypothetical protein
MKKNWIEKFLDKNWNRDKDTITEFQSALIRRVKKLKIQAISWKSKDCLIKYSDVIDCINGK